MVSALNLCMLSLHALLCADAAIVPPGYVGLLSLKNNDYSFNRFLFSRQPTLYICAVASIRRLASTSSILLTLSLWCSGFSPLETGSRGSHLFRSP